MNPGGWFGDPAEWGGKRPTQRTLNCVNLFPKLRCLPAIIIALNDEIGCYRGGFLFTMGMLVTKLPYLSPGLGFESLERADPVLKIPHFSLKTTKVVVASAEVGFVLQNSLPEPFGFSLKNNLFFLEFRQAGLKPQHLLVVLPRFRLPLAEGSFKSRHGIFQLALFLALLAQLGFGFDRACSSNLRFFLAAKLLFTEAIQLDT